MPDVKGTDLHYVFDMKGSQINREVLKDINKKQLESIPPTGGKVLKDLDYIRLKEMKEFMNIEQSIVKKILKQLTSDVAFFKDKKFMDYSLLFTVRKLSEKKVIGQKNKKSGTIKIINQLQNKNLDLNS